MLQGNAIPVQFFSLVYMRLQLKFNFSHFAINH